MPLIDISEEFIIHPCGNGIKLIAPNSLSAITSNSTCTVKDAMQFSCNVAFSNTDIAIQKINEQTAATLGFESPFKAIGDNISSMIKKDCAEKVFHCNFKALKTRKVIIDEGEIIRKDELPLNRLSLYMPWFDNDDRIIGAFGCSIIIGMQSLAKFFTHIQALGLLSQIKSPESNPSFFDKNTIHFSKRENECIYHIIRGKTLKEVAHILGLSKRTVEYYFECIKNKLGVNNKSDAITKLLDFNRIS